MAVTDIKQTQFRKFTLYLRNRQNFYLLKRSGAAGIATHFDTRCLSLYSQIAIVSQAEVGEEF